MEPAPVPRHERAWRHPSEIDPPSHEPTTAGGRVLIVTSAAVGLLFVGVLALAMVPNRTSPPAAVASTIALPRPLELSMADAVAPLEAEAAAVSSFSALSSRPSADSMVTPVGRGSIGITTLNALETIGAAKLTQLPSGEIVEIVVIDIDVAAGVAVVSFASTATEPGYRLAEVPPSPSDTVLVHGVEPTIVKVADVGALEVVEGAPVLDADGNLIGLCSKKGQDTELVLVDSIRSFSSLEPGAVEPTTWPR